MTFKKLKMAIKSYSNVKMSPNNPSKYKQMLRKEVIKHYKKLN